jgi:hypothetical protein
MANIYKVFFHAGPDLGLKTHVLRGTASTDPSGLSIQGPEGKLFVPAADIKEVELFRMHGMARVVRVDHQSGRLYVAAVRFMLGQFASVNFFKTGELHGDLADLAKSH